MEAQSNGSLDTRGVNKTWKGSMVKWIRLDVAEISSALLKLIASQACISAAMSSSIHTIGLFTVTYNSQYQYRT